VLLACAREVNARNGKSAHHTTDKTISTAASNTLDARITLMDTKGDPNDLLPPLCQNGRTVTRKQHQEDIDSMKTCPHSREEVIEMMDWGFDIDNDGVIDKTECESARNFYLNWWEKPVMESCDTVFRNCDCDGDGKMSKKDVMTSIDTCLRNCDKVMLLMKYVRQRIANRRAFT